MELKRLPLQETFASLPPEWPDDPLPIIRSALKETGHKIVVFDDDPTGTQTVHDVPVLTDSSVDILADELANDLPVFFIGKKLQMDGSITPRVLTTMKAITAEVDHTPMALCSHPSEAFCL